MNCSMPVTIRQENPKDYGAVFNLIAQAFAPLELSDHQEHFLVERLRTSPAFVPELSLVAEIDQDIVGYILLTKMHIQQGQDRYEALALAPLAVHPDYQGRGIGGSLIEQAHTQAREMGYRSAVVLGDPGYYKRYGYQQADTFGIALPFDVPQEYCMAIALVEGGLDGVSGTVVYSKEFFS